MSAEHYKEEHELDTETPAEARPDPDPTAPNAPGGAASQE
jgi:hypothetical protein